MTTRAGCSRQRGIIESISPKEVLPIQISEKKIEELGEVQVKYSKELSLEKLVVDNVYIIGEPESKFRIVFLLILSAVIVLLGISSFVVGSIMFYKNYNTFKETGKLPELPNTAESKIKGIKFLFGKREKPEK